MKLFMYSIGEKPRIGLENDGKMIDFIRAYKVFKSSESIETGWHKWSRIRSLADVIEMESFTLKFFTDVWNFIEKHGLIDNFAIEGEITFEVPLPRPSKILALGRNYKAHAEEGGLSVPDEPIIFDKVVTSMTAHNTNIVYPPQVTRLDHEIELALVIGKRAKNIAASEAMDFVAGYTIANDISARNMQERDIAMGNPWLRSKSFDTFTPIGPYLVPRDALPNAQDLVLELKVNGRTRQKSTTAKMVFDIPTMIAYISEHMTLLPGDIVLTGTPEGISALSVGDVVEATIEGIGTLTNTVVS